MIKLINITEREQKIVWWSVIKGLLIGKRKKIFRKGKWVYKKSCFQIRKKTKKQEKRKSRIKYINKWENEDKIKVI